MSISRPKINLIITGIPESGKASLAHALADREEVKAANSIQSLKVENYEQTVDLEIKYAPSNPRALFSPFESIVIGNNAEGLSQNEKILIDIAVFIYDATKSLSEQEQLLINEYDALRQNNHAAQKLLVVTKCPRSDISLPNNIKSDIEDILYIKKKLNIKDHACCALTISDKRIIANEALEEVNKLIVEAIQEQLIKKAEQESLDNESASYFKEYDKKTKYNQDIFIPNKTETNTPRDTPRSSRYSSGVNTASVTPKNLLKQQSAYEANFGLSELLANELQSKQNDYQKDDFILKAKANFKKANDGFKDKIKNDVSDLGKQGELLKLANEMQEKVDAGNLQTDDIENFKAKTGFLRVNCSWRVTLGAVIGAALGVIIGAMLGIWAGPGAAVTALMGGVKGAVVGASIGGGAGYLAGMGVGFWATGKSCSQQQVINEANGLIKHLSKPTKIS